MYDYPRFYYCTVYAVDQEMLEIPKRPDAKLSPSEVVTLALLFAIKGGGMRAFYRWLTRDYCPCSRRPGAHPFGAALQDPHGGRQVLAAPTVLGVADSYGIELIHPMREG